MYEKKAFYKLKSVIFLQSFNVCERQITLITFEFFVRSVDTRVSDGVDAPGGIKCANVAGVETLLRGERP